MENFKNEYFKKLDIFKSIKEKLNNKRNKFINLFLPDIKSRLFVLFIAFFTSFSSLLLFLLFNIGNIPYIKKNYDLTPFIHENLTLIIFSSNAIGAFFVSIFIFFIFKLTHKILIRNLNKEEKKLIKNININNFLNNEQFKSLCRKNFSEKFFEHFNYKNIINGYDEKIIDLNNKNKLIENTELLFLLANLLLESYEKDCIDNIKFKEKISLYINKLNIKDKSLLEPIFKAFNDIHYSKEDISNILNNNDAVLKQKQVFF